MNESENTTYGKCRCCSSMGHHRDLMVEYEWNGCSEIYSKIFLECFNLFLAIKTKKGTLICTSCILRLRDASSFKKMVLEAERSLLDYSIKEEHSRDTIDNIDIKTEKDYISECSQELQNEGREEIADEDIDKTEIYTDTIRETFCKTKDNRTEKLAYVYNSLIILENSNVAPFKPKKQNGFPCFYCRTKFEDITKLREHQVKHTMVELKKAFQAYGSNNFMVYVDITDLKCTICDEGIPSFNELKTHLVKKHKKQFQECPDRVIPFKITAQLLKCQICGCHFETFGSLDRHMNVHYRNYVCKECGTGYATRCRLKVHLKQHNGGAFECGVCKKVYSSRSKLKNHIDIVHNMVKRFKCAKCDERFTEYLRRQKHMVEAHGAPPLEYKCNVCDKSYEIKYLLSMHMKRHHLEQKDYKCDVCVYSCYSRQELKVHMIKHNGERIYECSVCKKSYARKKTLREHMRIHNNDRRYVCKVCGQAFVQNCSLKGHVKTHHPETL